MLLKFSIGFEFHLSNEKHYELKSFQTNLISLSTTTKKRGKFFFTITKKIRENCDVFYPRKFTRFAIV